MKKLILYTLLIPFIGHGAVEPVIINLLEGESYTVPANKALIIESASSFDAGTDYGECWIEIVSSGTTNGPMRLISGYTHTFAKPIKIPAGNIITRISRGYPASSTLTMFCLLVDYSELYASIPTQTDTYLAQNGVFSFDVKTATSKPVRIVAEGSSDLTTGWNPVDATVEKKAPGTYTVAIETDSKNYFAKYTMRNRD